MKKRADCGEGQHVYGVSTSVGGGMYRSVCETCNMIRLEIMDEPITPNDLFTSQQRHGLFSPLVEYAALHGHDLMTEPRVFGRRPERKQSPALARAS